MAQAEDLLQAVLETIQISLACGESVTITNFGRFEARKKNAVTRVNPRSGKVIEVPAKRSVAFQPSPAMKQRMNR